MKKHVLFTAAILTLVFSCSGPNPSFKEDGISLVPKPNSFVLKEQSFRFQSDTKVIVQDESQVNAAKYLIGLLNTAAGFELSIIDEFSEKGILYTAVDGLAPDAYQLTITPEKIVISASSEGGFFNGVQTIRQLLPPQIESKTKVAAQWLVPCVEIKDEPRFAWRGMHMDFSRHFFDVGEVKTFLDYMALYKLNTFHMHLTDDQGWRIEIKKYPLLTEKGAWRLPNNQDSICNERAMENELYTIDKNNFKEIDGKQMYGGFFTQEEIKDIVKYADQRGITVIPEIDMPGHFKSAIDNYPFLSCNEGSAWDTVFSEPACLGEETTYEFMENILAEVAGLFPGEYIHIGGDEVNIKTWEECPKCQSEIKKHDLKDEHELQSRFNRCMEKFLQSKGKRLMGWDEIVRGGLTEDASMMWWRNWAPKAPHIAADNGNDIVVTTTAAYYFDYLNEGTPVQKVYSYEPVPEDFTPEQTKHILGVQANLWSEWIPNFKRLQYQAFPRMLALAETCWTEKENKNLDGFFKRLEKQYERMDVMDVHYYISAVEGLQKKIVFVDSTLIDLNLSYQMNDAQIYYTLDGSVPTKKSILYSGPISIDQPGVIKSRAYKGNIFNDIKSAEIEQQEYREASNMVPSNKGLQRWTVQGKFNRVKDIKRPKAPIFTQVDSIALTDEFDGKTGFSMVFEGYFHAGEDGVYDFEIRSDGGSLVYLGTDIIVDNGGYHGPRKRYGKVALKKGWHPFSIHYVPSKNPRMIEAWVTKPGGVPESL